MVFLEGNKDLLGALSSIDKFVSLSRVKPILSLIIDPLNEAPLQRRKRSENREKGERRSSVQGNRKAPV